MNELVFLVGLAITFKFVRKYSAIQYLGIASLFICLAVVISSIWGCNFGLLSFSENSSCLSTGYSALTNEYSRNRNGNVNNAGMPTYWFSLGASLGCVLCAAFVLLTRTTKE